MSRSCYASGRTQKVFQARGQRRPEVSITNAVFAWSILLPLVLHLANPFFRLPEFAPPQVIYAKDLVSLLLGPWTFPSTTLRIFSRLLQSPLLFRLPEGNIFPCYLLWIVIALARTLIGFVLSRGVGWTYPRLFNHWALYESSGGFGPTLVAYFLASGVRPDLSPLLTLLKGHKWEVTESLVLLGVCTFLAVLDHAPWTYGVAVGLAIPAIVIRTVLSIYSPETPYGLAHTGADSHQVSPRKCSRRDIQLAFLLLAFISLPNLASSFLTRPAALQPPSLSEDGALFLEIVLLSYPRPNDTPPSPDHRSILSETIASYLPYVSPSTVLSVFTHAKPFTHTSFMDAQRHYKDAPVTFYADQDTHPDAHQGQHLHLAEAFRWLTERGGTRAEWVMLVEDDFPVCGEWGWQGIVRVMHALKRGHNFPSPDTTKMWGGFVGTGGSGLILHRTLLPILAHTLRMHALVSSPFPPFMARRPPDIVIQDCLLGVDPLCPTAPSSKDAMDRIWIARRQPSMVITSRLVMDHIGGSASTAKGRRYDAGRWRCGWRHPFHGRPEVTVVPV